MKVQSAKGFTLIELVVVVVLLGIMAAGAGLLISRPIEAYSDQLRRQQLVDSAEMAMRKIESDIRRALPNSLRIIENNPNSWSLEMINTVDGARYRDEAGGVGYDNPEDILDFTTPGGDDEFNLLGRFASLAAGNHGFRAVIYNTNPVDIYTDAASGINPGIISMADGFTLSVDGNEHKLTLASPYQFSYQSPTQRLFIVDGPISYLCNNGTENLLRFDKYDYHANQSDVDTEAKLVADGANATRVATQLSSCRIDYQAGSPQRGGLITLDISLTDGQGETVRLLHQVHVDNVP